MFIRSTFIVISLFLSVASFCQKQISETDAVSMAVKNSKNISASDLVIKQQKQLLKSSINLPNPEVFVESPTGNFYTGSVTQSIEFPTVYGKQYQLQKQRIGLAEKEKIVTEIEIKFQVKQLYLLLQYADTLQKQLYIQDTVYAGIASSASRQFDAGQINYLQKVFTETQYGEIHNQYLQSQISVSNLQSQLQFLTGLQEPFRAIQLTSQLMGVAVQDSAALIYNPTIQLYKQTQNISQKNIELQKNKALPGLAIGYFNQGERSTPVGNRFRFGITVPLWFGQYKGNINAARTELEIAKQKTNGLQQQLSVQLIQAQNELTMNEQSLKYYQTTGIKKANEIINTAKRFFESGENDYINYLRNINDAYLIQLKYLEAIRNYNQSILSIKYLTGTL
ncbi:MAG: TolC family protein [Ferruginibacter sp.]